MYGSNSIIGRRKAQEDVLCVGADVSQNGNCRLFGVFDGHGGRGGERCAKLAARQLPKIVRDNLAKAAKASKENIAHEEVLGQVLQKSFVQFDEYLTTLPNWDADNLLEKQKKKKWSWLFPQESVGFRDAGSCACVVVETKNAYVFANLGDSRAILSNGKRVTADHTSLNLGEVSRIYEAGGWSIKNRVCGNLVPTRVFGDFEMKTYKRKGVVAVSNVPEIHVIPKTEDLPKFVIVMCDGIHDVMKDAEIARLAEENSTRSCEAIAKVITAEAYRRGSKDNLSCIVIRTGESEELSSTSVSSLEGDETSYHSE